LRYYLDPFGCVKNQVDAENMMAALDNAGWSSVPEAEEASAADLIIVNSCGFIQSAKQESINAVLGWRKLYPEKKILLTGCLAQRYAKELAESMPEADGFFGVKNISKIAEKANSLICEPRSKNSRSPSLEQPPSESPAPHSRPLLSLPGSAYVKISEGCDNNCSYCAIPLIRGPLHCRPAADILNECKGLLARGIKELCVIGQDVCSYRQKGYDLCKLLNAIARIRGDFWVRLLYMHPDNFSLPILDLMANDKRFLPYFDIPFQHASPKILSAMNRRGTGEKYIELVDAIRSRFPDAVIRTTFLLGFPGETEDDFAALLDFQEKIRPDWLGCFTFSREEDTAAYSMKGRVPQKTAALRKWEVEKRQIEITQKNMDRFVGQHLEVLLEERFGGEGSLENEAGGGEKLWIGRLYCHAPEVDGAAVIVGGDGGLGDIVPCKVVARRGIDLEVRCIK